MAAASSPKWVNRANGVLGFLVGIFGALAIIGVFFKIAKLPNYELFMTVGFMGEAAAFVLMGLFALITGFTAKSAAPDEDDGPRAVAAGPVNIDLGLEAFGEEFREELRQATVAFRAELRERLLVRFANDFDAASEAVAQDVASLGAEMRGLGLEMQSARASVHAMKGQLEQAATVRLGEGAGALAGQMHHLTEEVSAAGASAQRMRSDLDMMAHRFHNFNHMGNGQVGNGQGRSGNGHASQTSWIAGPGEAYEHEEVAR